MRFEKQYPKSKEIGSSLQKMFKQRVVEKLARETEFVKKASPMTGIKFLQTMISGTVGVGLEKSLNELCTIAAKLGVKIGEQSLNERFNDRSVDFFIKLFKLALKVKFNGPVLKVLKPFSQIILEDSTIISLPESLVDLFKGFGGDASKAALKIDYAYNLKDDNIKMQLLDGKHSDMSVGLPSEIPERSLFIRDLGYFKTSDFEKIKQAKAFYLSRFKHDRNLYLFEDKDAKAVDLLKIKRSLKVNEVREMEVYMGSQRFKTRVILQRVPSKVIKQRKADIIKARSKKREKPTQKRLDLCGISVFITNVQAEECTGVELMKLYKIRWQIEIIFKVWKSVLKMGQVKEVKPDRFLCSLYAQLIWLVINIKIFQSFKNHIWNQFNVEISEIKGYKMLLNFKNEILQAILKNRKIEYEKLIHDIYDTLFRLGKKQYKKGNPNPIFHITK